MGDAADLYDDTMDLEDYFELREDAPARCIHCGARLTWKQIDGRWKPHTETGRRHLCKPFLESIRPDINAIFKAIK